MTEENNGASVEERAAAGENEQDLLPPEPPMQGEVQLSLNIGGIVSNRNARKVETATLSLSSAEREVDGLLDVDTEYDLLVRVLPGEAKSIPVRDPNTRKTKAFKMRQNVGVLSIRRADESAIADLFAELLARDEAAAGKLLDQMAEALKEPVAA